MRPGTKRDVKTSLSHRYREGSALLYSLRSTYNAVEVVYGGVWYGTGRQHVSLLRRAY